jgi:BirA family biotin operon repressor/biotin-[acetyl-CoA-carboxylase] ligase
MKFFRIFKNKDFINLKALREELSKQSLDLSVELIRNMSSHLYAKQKNVSKDTLFVAIRQKNGVGRLNRRFISNKGGCYFSLALADKKENALAAVPVISVAIATVLSGYMEGVSVKWPNDILVKGKKICGILCSSCVHKTVISAGINLWNDISALGDSATSFYAQGAHKGVTRASLIARIISEYYKLSTVDFEIVRKEYDRLLNIVGKKVTVSRKNGVVEGRVKGLDKNGFLILQSALGQEYTIAEGDVTVN